MAAWHQRADALNKGCGHGLPPLSGKDIMSARDPFTLVITCPGCGQGGAVAWEEDDARTAGRRGARKLMQVSPGFHSESGRTQSGDRLIVCDQCDEIQPD
jgi:hypothetical protein